MRELREPVRFADAVDRLHRDGMTAYVELGPGTVPARMLDDWLPEGGEQPLVLSASRRPGTGKRCGGVNPLSSSRVVGIA